MPTNTKAKLSTWYSIADSFCARQVSLLAGGPNPYYEHFADRRYNYATSSVPTGVRLVFRDGVKENPTNKTLARKGRFLWCKNMRYEGIGDDKYRHISFTIASGQKRFNVTERDFLSIASNVYVNNNSYFKKYNKVFTSFSTVFAYRDALKMMKRNDGYRGDVDEFADKLSADSPFQPGVLVYPRKGYLFPRLSKLSSTLDGLVEDYCMECGAYTRRTTLLNYLTGRDYITTDPELQDLFTDFQHWSEDQDQAKHPVGIVLGKSRNISPHSGRELYRVSFADTIYEEVHPMQLEIITNEI